MFEKLKMQHILNYEELIRLIKIFVVNLGITKIRLTGGEPLARKNILSFFRMLAELKKDYPFELGITTNGTLLENKISELKQLGLNKINISLDTLNPEKYKKITGKDEFKTVLNSILLAEELEFSPVKINTVIMKRVNDDEIIDLVEFVKERDFNIRFIEYMPFTSNGWNDESFISSEKIKKLVELNYKLQEIKDGKITVAKDFQIVGYKGKVSFISSISNHFCDSCNRLRITSEGNLKLCLFSPQNEEISLKYYLRSENYSDNYIAQIILNSLQLKKLKHPEIEELLQIDQNNMLRIGG
jgi:cyclic pyranopterin phosphate synthase